MTRHYSPTRRDAYRVNRANDRARTVARSQERAAKRAQNANAEKNGN